MARHRFLASGYLRVRVPSVPEGIVAQLAEASDFKSLLVAGSSPADSKFSLMQTSKQSTLPKCALPNCENTTTTSFCATHWNMLAPPMQKRLADAARIYKRDTSDPHAREELKRAKDKACATLHKRTRAHRVIEPEAVLEQARQLAVELLATANDLAFDFAVCGFCGVLREFKVDVNRADKIEKMWKSGALNAADFQRELEDEKCPEI